MTAEPSDRTGGWDEHGREQTIDWLKTSPAQRLAWLEQAIAFAAEAGVLPRRDTGTDEAPNVSD